MFCNLSHNDSTWGFFYSVIIKVKRSILNFFYRMQREKENFANMVDKELEKNNETNLQTLLHKKESVSVLNRNEGVAIPNVTPA